MLALANVDEAETMVDSAGVVVGVVQLSCRTVGEDENEDNELLKLVKPKLAGCFHPKVIVPTNQIPRNTDTGEVDYDFILGLTTKARAGEEKIRNGGVDYSVLDGDVTRRRSGNGQREG